MLDEDLGRKKHPGEVLGDFLRRVIIVVGFVVVDLVVDE